METKVIECKSIYVHKDDTSKRTFSKEFAVKLAGSIKIDGQQNPIIVRKSPEEGKYVLVAGRHRLYAIKSVLKEQFIRVTVMDDMTAEEASIAADVENLWRNPLSKAQHAGAVARWNKHWMERHSTKATGEPQGDGEATSIAHNEQSSGEAGEASERAFDRSVAEATGQSIASVRRAKLIGKSFTPDQLEVFTQMGTSQADMLTITKVKDAKARGEIVSLIASGMGTAEAIAEVVKEAAPRKYNSPGLAKTVAKHAVETPVLTDDEWFAVECGEKAGYLGDPTKYRSDAILYRHTIDLTHSIAAKVRKCVKETKKAGNTGSLCNLVGRLFSLSHPKDWLICPTCKGTGVSEVEDHGDHVTKTRCPKCFGGGYLMKTEDYV